MILDVKIDAKCSWQYHVNDCSSKLNIANVFLNKMRKCVSLKILRFMFFSIFDSYLSCCSLARAPNRSTIQRIVVLQKRLSELSIFNQAIPIPVPHSNKPPS